MHARLITEDQARIVSDRRKIRRAKKSVGNELQRTQRVDFLYGLYFDERKDKTIAQVKHMSLVAEPDSQYIGHVAPGSGEADAECQAIMSHLEVNSVDLQDFQVASADGTNVNTGWMSGVVCKIEVKLNRPLQLVI